MRAVEKINAPHCDSSQDRRRMIKMIIKSSFQRCSSSSGGVMLALLSLLMCLAIARGATYDTDEGIRSVWLSAAAYCDPSTYLTRTYNGPTAGFVPTYYINSNSSSGDATGYIGYLPSAKSIYVVYRGSSSISNWIADLDAFKIDYSSFPECNCQVHKGFYLSEQVIIDDVIAEVSSLLKKFPTYKVKVTGHSLGAAMAQLTSMDLVKAGISASVYNYGQPRTGDSSYASFATSKVQTFRVTHHTDIVPHLPITAVMEFYHLCTEEYEDGNGNVKTCTNTCEDPSCADQFSESEWTTSDHLTYLGLDMACSSV